VSLHLCDCVAREQRALEQQVVILRDLSSGEVGALEVAAEGAVVALQVVCRVGGLGGARVARLRPPLTRTQMGWQGTLEQKGQTVGQLDGLASG
jgi:hypothetical protein